MAAYVTLQRAASVTITVLRYHVVATVAELAATSVELPSTAHPVSTKSFTSEAEAVTGPEKMALTRVWWSFEAGVDSVARATMESATVGSYVKLAVLAVAVLGVVEL